MSAPIRQAAWRLVLPEIRKIVREEISDQPGGFRGEMQGEFKGLQGEFKSIQGQFDAVHSEIRRLDEKIESVRKELSGKIDGLEKRMDLVQHVGVLQHKASELEEKLRKPT